MNIRITKANLRHLLKAINGPSSTDPQLAKIYDELNLALELNTPGSPEIIVTYYSDCEPNIELPAGMKAKIKFIDGDKENDRFMEHGGVVIYHTHREAYPDMLSENFFCVEHGEHDESEIAFDWRDLADIPDDKQHHYHALFPGATEADEQKRVIAHAIDTHEIEPYNPTT